MTSDEWGGAILGSPSAADRPSDRTRHYIRTIIEAHRQLGLDPYLDLGVVAMDVLERVRLALDVATVRGTVYVRPSQSPTVIQVLEGTLGSAHVRCQLWARPATEAEAALALAPEARPFADAGICATVASGEVAQ